RLCPRLHEPRRDRLGQPDHVVPVVLELQDRDLREHQLRRRVLRLLRELQQRRRRDERPRLVDPLGSVTNTAARATTVRPRVIAAVAAILFVIASVWAGLPANATVEDDPLSGFTQAERDLFESGAPAILTVDPATGDFTAIDA